MLYEKLLPATIEGGTPTDPNFNQVSLLLHGDGTNGAQNNTFLDSSTNNFTITRTGNVAQGTFSPFSLAEGQWSNYFDGSGDYLTIPYSTTAFDWWTNDYTLEAWIYPTSLTGWSKNGPPQFSSLIGNMSATASTNYWSFGIDSSNGKCIFTYYNGSSAYAVSSANTVTLNSWNHIAMTKSSSGISIFINGVGSSAVAINGTPQSSASVTLTIGQYWATTAIGYVSNIRIVKGTAVYSGSTYTVPTAPLTAISGTSLLTCQSNRFKDNSSNNFTITRNGDTKVTAFSPFAPSATYDASTNGGSGYFDGSGDRLQIADTSSLDLDGSAFNVEYWIYPLASPANITVTGKMSGFTSNPTAGWSMWLSSMRPTFGINGIFNSLVAPAANAIRVGEWSHIAASSDGSTYTNLYVNGVRVATTSSLLTNNTSLPMVIGSNINGTTWNADYPVTGYIQDLRVVKGTAIYTGTTYTVPTAPLTAVTNTQLLLNCTNAGIYDNAIKNDIETVGNAQISTSVKKYGTGSMAFDGTGDWLYLADKPELQLGSGNFTVEGWVYLGTTGVAQGIIGKGTATTGWLLSTNSSNQLVYTDGSSTTTGGTALSGSTWYHIAVVRSGSSTGNVKIYLNGVADATSSGAITTAYTQTNVMYIGANRTGGNAMNGYIDDLRITKGIARYTTNFTPPTQAFPNV